MKNLKIFSVLSLLFLSISCTDQEDVVVFYIDETFTKELDVSLLENENTAGTFYTSSDLLIQQSDIYAKHVHQLKDLEIKTLEVVVSKGSNQKFTGALHFDNQSMLQFDQSSANSYSITNNEMLRVIENNLLQNKKLHFSFSTSSNNFDPFKMKITIKTSGIFVD